MARTVTDAAILLGAMEARAGPERSRPPTRCTPPPNRDYTPHLRAGALAGRAHRHPARVLLRRRSRARHRRARGGLNAAQLAVMDEAIADPANEGAIIVDPADIPSVIDPTPANNFLLFGACAGLANRKGLDATARSCSSTA